MGIASLVDFNYFRRFLPKGTVGRVRSSYNVTCCYLRKAGAAKSNYLT
jgi:hypothetical protein